MPPWKGLDPERRPVFLGYEQTERLLAGLLDAAAAWRPQIVAAIARGGIVPGSMAASLLGLDLALIGHDRASGAIGWIGAAHADRRVLLVDDGASSGATLAAVRQVLLDEGRDCLTLAVVHDPETARHLPDLSHPMRALWRFPWERGEATPAGRARRAQGLGPDRSTEAPYTAVAWEVLASPSPPALAPASGVVARPSLATPSLPSVRWKVGITANTPIEPVIVVGSAQISSAFIAM